MTETGATASSRMTITVDNVQLTVYVYDDRQVDDDPTLILIHGAGGNYLLWPPALRRLSGVRVVAPDLPGHGRSAGRGYDRVEPYARCIGGLADALGLERVVVVGHSMGGAISLEYAHQYSETVAGLGILACGDRLPIQAELVALLAIDCRTAMETITDASLARDINPRSRELYLERLLETDPEVMRRDFAASQRYDSQHYATTLDVPTVIVAGSRDRIASLSTCRALNDAMPDSELTILDGASHMFLWEYDGAVIQCLRTLLDRTRFD